MAVDTEVFGQLLWCPKDTLSGEEFLLAIQKKFFLTLFVKDCLYLRCTI